MAPIDKDISMTRDESRQRPGAAGDAREVQVALHPVEGWPPLDSELLWVRPLPGRHDVAVLDSIPLFALDLAWQDQVRLERRDGVEVIVGVHARGGHSTVRVLLADVADAELVCDALHARGAGVERSFVDALIAVDIAPDRDAAAVLQWLSEAEAAGTLEWEEGFLAAAHAPS